jgi:hypothetical protein
MFWLYFGLAVAGLATTAIESVVVRAIWLIAKGFKPSAVERL